MASISDIAIAVASGLSALASSALVLVGLRGLKQVEEARKTNELVRNQARVKMSVRILEKFAEKIMEYAKLQKTEVVLYQGPTNEKFDATIFVSNPKVNTKSSNEQVLDFINGLEGLAAQILLGLKGVLIEEEDVYKPIGESFVSMINTVYDVICFHRTAGNPNMYSNIVELYARWERRVADADNQHYVEMMKQELSRNVTGLKTEQSTKLINDRSDHEFVVQVVQRNQNNSNTIGVPGWDVSVDFSQNSSGTLSINGFDIVPGSTQSVRSNSSGSLWVTYQTGADGGATKFELKVEKYHDQQNDPLYPLQLQFST